MERDILSEVIEVEREIQKCLELEKTRAQEWLEKVKRGSSEELARSEREIRETFDRALADAEKEAAVKAAQVVREAEAQVARLRTLDDGLLTRIVAKQTRKILPG
jgi:vacuolar-type H+-ATPase subunit H